MSTDLLLTIGRGRVTRLHRATCHRMTVDRAAVPATYGTVLAIGGAKLATCCKPTERQRAELPAQVTVPEPERTAADPCLADA